MHQFQVENMTCSHCAQTVERAVKSVDAGAKVSVDLASKAVTAVVASGSGKMLVQGDVANFISAANFTVRGESINASTATFVGGTAANLVNGRTVRIKAQATNGHLVATEVTLL